MADTKRLFDYFRVDLHDLQSAAMNALWASLFAFVFGILLIVFPLILLISSSVIPSPEEGMVQSFVVSRVLALSLTLLVLIPLIKFLRWVTKKTNQSHHWIVTHSDPIIALLLTVFAPITVFLAANRIPTDPLVQSDAEIFFTSGIYLLFSAVGVASAAGFVTGITIIGLYFKWLDVDRVITAIKKVYQWILLRKPIQLIIQFRRYSYQTNRTYFGAVYTIIESGAEGMAAELSKVDSPEESDEEGDGENGGDDDSMELVHNAD